MSLLRWHRRAVARFSSKLWADGKGLERSVRAVLLLCMALLPALACLSRAPSVSIPPELPSGPIPHEESVVDLQADGGAPVRRGIPKEPADWQKRPPCPKEMGEREIRGACYFRIHPEDMKPPCHAPALEHGDFCWRAVAKLQRSPSSIGR